MNRRAVFRVKAGVRIHDRRLEGDNGPVRDRNPGADGDGCGSNTFAGDACREGYVRQIDLIPGTGGALGNLRKDIGFELPDNIASRVVLTYPDIGGTATSAFVSTSDLCGALPDHLCEMAPGRVPCGLAIGIQGLFRVPKIYHLSGSHYVACPGHILAVY